jgi:DNA-binding HxlR family transcriptional regulator
VACQEAGLKAALELAEHFARELEVLAKRWTLQLLVLLLQRPARLSELERAVPGLTNRVLADRLRELQDAGLVDRQVDPGPPIMSIYALTARARRCGRSSNPCDPGLIGAPAHGRVDPGLGSARTTGQPRTPYGGVRSGEPGQLAESAPWRCRSVRLSH